MLAPVSPPNKRWQSGRDDRAWRLGPIGVARRDRFIDFRVRIIGLLRGVFPAMPVQRHVALLHQPFGESRMDGSKIGFFGITART